MTLNDAERLAAQIETDDPMCAATWRNYDGCAVVDVTDKRSGYSFVVTCREDWEERKAECELNAQLF